MTWQDLLFVVCSTLLLVLSFPPLSRERSVKRSVPLDPPVVTQDCTDEIERLRAENERLRERSRVSPTARYLVRVFLLVFVIIPFMISILVGIASTHVGR